VRLAAERGGISHLLRPGNFLRRKSVELDTCGIGQEATMNGLIYLVGLIVVIMFILSFLGLR
jgi:hypothetical protein